MQTQPTNQVLEENLDPSKGPIKVIVRLEPAKPCEHEFIWRTDEVLGQTAQCKKCNAGHILTAGSKVQDGHIYLEGKKLV